MGAMTNGNLTGSTPIRITVKFDPGRCSPNLRLHWADKAARHQAANIAAHCAWHGAGCPTVEGAVTVSLTVRRCRAMDPDNLLAGMKSMLDSLFCRRRHGWGVTEDDSAGFIHYGNICQETGKRWRGREEVEMEIIAR